MKQLILFARPGVAVVSGFVKAIDNNVVVIENNVYLPVSRCVQSKRLRIIFQSSDKVSRLRLSTGAFIIATVNDEDPNFEVVLSGGETQDMVYTAIGYNIRYNGCFDFASKGQHKETHIFIGKISDIKKNSYKGMPCSTFKLDYTSQRENITHNIGCWNKVSEMLSKPGKYAVVCGAPVHTAYGLQYTARRIIEC